MDKRTDIWAFGCVLYEMLTGRQLFQGCDLAETLASIVKDSPELSTVPPQVRRLLARCLENDSARRLRDLGDAWDLLDDPGPAPALPSAHAVAIGAVTSMLEGWGADGTTIRRARRLLDGTGATS